MLQEKNRHAATTRIEALAESLSSAVQLTFAEPTAGAFYSEAKRVIAKTRRTYRSLVKGLTERSRGTPGIETLLDNSHKIASVLSELSANWRRKETLRLPQVVDENGRRRPRAYLISAALLGETSCGVERHAVTTFLSSYQKTAPLSVRELDVFPDMLRFCLIEELTVVMDAISSTLREVDEAERWLNKMAEAANQRDAESRLAALANQLTQEYKVVTVRFGFHMLQRIGQSGLERELRVVSRRLRLSLARQGMAAARLSEIVARTDREHSLKLDRIIASLHWLGQMRWDKLSLPLNEVDKVLARDPSAAFAELTDDTRAAYRRTVVRIADRTGVHDVEVAKEALRLSRAAAVPRHSHVGYFLVDDGVAQMERSFQYERKLKETVRGAVMARPTAFFFGVIGLITVLLTAAAFVVSGASQFSVWAMVAMALCALILSSEIAVVFGHIIFTNLVPPRPLPQVDLRKGIGRSRRTVIAVPSMFRDSRSARHLLEKLEMNFVTNVDQDVFFALLLDFSDAKSESLPGDADLVAEMRVGIDRLNAAYPSDVPRFSLFYRRRMWNDRDKVFMGWERKRGKLQEFNALLRGRPNSYGGDAAAAAALLGDVRYVLTIDEDVILTRDSARALVGTIDHPLNRPVIDPLRRVVTHGYGIVMPRSAVLFKEWQASAFSRIFGGSPGIEAYSTIVSDLHQDMFGDGIFQGKGIYDVDAFSATMEGRIPDNLVLSHDLLEGLYARVGTAANAHIFEGFPSAYRSYCSRAHRWIRGDWQIISWIFPARGGVLSTIGRWRIVDNLRRSLLPIALSVAVMLALFLPTSSLFWSLLGLTAIGAGQLLPTLMRVLGLTTSPDLRISPAYRLRTAAAEISTSFAKVLLLGMLALQSAVTAVDAITRSLWRLTVSRRKLLQWQTSYEADESKGGAGAVLRFFWPGDLVATAIVILNFVPGVTIDPQSLVWASAWAIAPYVTAAISRRTAARPLPSGDDEYLRSVAAQSYWFFVDMTNRDTQWLPPDHYQEEPVSRRHAHGLGLSPTNLGMYLLSISAAREMGLATLSEYGMRISGAFHSLSQLERHRGHFFNWYELRHLKPLPPKYVSSVDSANCALAMLAVRNALLEACRTPIFSRAMFDGFDAELAVLAGWTSRALTATVKDSAARRLLREVADAVAQSRALVREARAAGVTPREGDLLTSGVVHHAVRMRNTLEALRLEEGTESFEEVYLAARHIENLANENRELTARYLSYAVVPAVSAVTADPAVRLAYGHLAEELAKIPSLNELVEGSTRKAVTASGFGEAVEKSALAGPEKDSARAWYAEVISRLGEAESRAHILRNELHSASAEARRYFDQMDFAFLYDEERGLFHMGYNAQHDYLDEIFYDLFASEANSVSIVGIAKNQAPREHWAYLSRRMVRSANGQATPVSWAGSLFEYLGTMVYFDVPKTSFWGATAQRAVAAHRKFGRRRSIPWGMGESASSSMDAVGNYHYQAFGEPSIGFKRNLSDSVVVAPYTTALSLPVVGSAAVKNLRHVARAGAVGRYGFYDALDYTAFSGGLGTGGVPARIYYAHHQGFIISSIANEVLNGWVRRMISAEPDMRAAAELFEEKMPDVPSVEPLARITPPGHALSRFRSVLMELPRRYMSSRPKTVQWNYLSNGAYSIKLSTGGAGFSRFGGFEITRLNDGPVSESRGIFHYVFDRKRDRLWSPTHMPTHTVGEKSSVSVSGQISVFEKSHEGIDSRLSVAVDPVAPVEIRELRLTNRRSTTAVLTIGSCAELSLARPSERHSNKNFQNLFLASETAFDGSGIVAWRSDARKSDKLAAVACLVTTPDGAPEGLRLTRDRESFFGPLIDRSQPMIMRNPDRARADLPRHTLDTAVGYVSTVLLHPGESYRISLVISAGETRQAATDALRPYRAYRHVRKVLSGAGQAGAAAISRMGVTLPQAELFDTLASMLAARKDFASPGLPQEGTPMVRTLWKCGISGTRPIVLLSVSSLADLPSVRQMLACHQYFGYKGVEADIVILNEHRGGYLRTLEDEIDFLLRMHGEAEKANATRMYYVRGEELNGEEERLLHLSAVVRLDAELGSLAFQLRSQRLAGTTHVPPTLQPADPGAKAAFNEVSRSWMPTDVSQLAFWNGIGGYDETDGAYVIAPPKGVFPPAPWANVVANEHAGFIVTDRGSMFSWSRNSRDNKLTKAYNDPMSEATGESFYVRDDVTGERYAPQPVLGSREARYETRHYANRSEFDTHQGGLGIRLTAHVAADAPVKYVTVTLRNDTDKPRQLTVYGYFELLLGSFAPETKKQLVFSQVDGNTLIVRNAYRNDFEASRVFLGIAGGADGFTASKEEFIGRFGTLRAPAALSRVGLSSHLNPDGEPAAALCRKVTLQPGQEDAVVFFLGEAGSAEALNFLLAKVRSAEASKLALAESAEFWHSFPKLEVDLPDRSLTVLTNRFLTQQTVASRIFGRTGFYQIGGAFGFRDQLQDVLAMLWHDPALARRHILTCAARQFPEGDVLSWWHPHNEFGARTLLSDQHLWLPHAVARYVEFTGDVRILDEEIPYLEGDVPDAERRSVVGVFRPGATHGTLYEHCLRAVERSFTAGSHGLPLIGSADWNDSMNRVGSEGRGESIWLAWFTVTVLHSMADISAQRGEADRAGRYRAEAQRYVDAVQKSGWDGSWFRRAYTDHGVPVGTRTAKSWRIDSISQSWAVFALGVTQQTMTALQSIKQEFRLWEGSVPLAWPPSSPELLDLGMLSDYPPGVRENAGQYNHAALWLAQALFLAGDADAGKQVIDAVNPFKKTETPEKLAVYRGEPYVLAADVYSAPTYPGRAGWTWYTASSGVLYRTVVEYLLGLKMRGEMLGFNPALPTEWDGAGIRYQHKSSLYDIRYKVDPSATEVHVSVDGQAQAGPEVRLIDDGQTHEVAVIVPRATKKD